MKKIIIVGSTGSIGKQVVKVAVAHPDKFSICALCAHSNVDEFERQLNILKPEYAALSCADAAKRVGNIPKTTAFYGGEDAVIKLIKEVQADVVFVAVSGFAGLKYSLAAINAKKDVALANKETLVCGGDVITPLAKSMGVNVIPVDSEHSAIWQCLNFNAEREFKNLIITASGGAFRDYSKEELKKVTPAQALNHPTWQMGAKITVDCATLLNKGYEVIEAHHLYNADYNSIKTVIHRESIIHSMVEFTDGAILAQMGVPSMILPIQLALTYPKRYDCEVGKVDFSKAFTLNFQPVDEDKYPCFKLALNCGIRGGTAPTALNAAAEVAVNAFLSGKLSFLDIAKVCDGVLQEHEVLKATDYSTLENADILARRQALKLISR